MIIDHVYYNLAAIAGADPSACVREQLQQLVEQVLNSSNAALQKDERGKPSLVAHPDIHISLSHSTTHVAAAVAHVPVGIDIESAYRQPPWQRLAKRYYSIAEQEYVAVQADPLAAFMRIWTAKEAYVKATGTGLALKISELCVESQCVGGIAGINQLQYDHVDDSHLSVCLLRPEPFTIHRVI